MDVAVEKANTVNGGAVPAAEAHAHATVLGGEQPKTRYSPGAQVIGEIVGLLSQSSSHRHLFLADLEWLIGPPVALRQFRIFRDEQKPVAVAFWASVSDEVEKELIAGRPRLRPNEWKSGERLWLLDVIAPSLANKPAAMERLLADLAQTAFNGKSCKTRVVDQKTGIPKTIELGITEKSS